jgi:hypothetical protein
LTFPSEILLLLHQEDDVDSELSFDLSEDDEDADVENQEPVRSGNVISQPTAPAGKRLSARLSAASRMA